jgi:hypothetical protein
MGTGAKVAIGVGAAALVGLAIYLLTKKKAVADAEAIGGAGKKGLASVGKKVGSIGGSAEAGPDSTEEETPNAPGSVAPTAATSAPAEASAIQYIADGGSGGGSHPGAILIKLVDGVMKTGDAITIKHPNYNGNFTVLDNNDNYGGSIIYVATPFISAGAKTEDNNLIDRQPGTVAVIGESSASSFSGANGKKHTVKKIKFFTKAQGAGRKAKHAAGKKKGLKGAALRTFIRSKAKPKKSHFDSINS